jgi:hypothetical protein
MQASKFSVGDECEIDDGSGSMRAGKVSRAPGDSYFVETDDGHCWVGVHQIFKPGEKVLADPVGASAPPPEFSASEAKTDAPPAATASPKAKPGKKK